MSEWRDYQLPADETLRVLAGNRPTLRYRLRFMVLGLLGCLLTLAALIAAWCVSVSPALLVTTLLMKADRTAFHAS